MAPGHLHGDSLLSSPGTRYWMPGSATMRARQAERDKAMVAQLPDPSLRMPPSTGLLYPVTDCHVGKGDA
jgi:hypothetical protein